MFFDSHSHYDSDRFNRDRDATLEAVHKAGVDYIVNIGADIKSSLDSVMLSQKYPFIYASVGVHPHDAQDMKDGDIDILKDLASDDKVRALGEMGLDYYRDLSPRDIQKKRFCEQMELARDIGMNVVIHERDAYRDTLNVLKSFKGVTGVFHCFSGAWENAREVLSLGYIISFPGFVTFPNAKKAVEAVRYVPLDKMMIETDCPYMAPVPHRGKRCDSSMLLNTAAKIAEIKGVPLQEVAYKTKENALKFYGIEK